MSPARQCQCAAYTACVGAAGSGDAERVAALPGTLCVHDHTQVGTNPPEGCCLPCVFLQECMSMHGHSRCTPRTRLHCKWGHAMCPDAAMRPCRHFGGGSAGGEGPRQADVRTAQVCAAQQAGPCSAAWRSPSPSPSSVGSGLRASPSRGCGARPAPQRRQRRAALALSLSLSRARTRPSEHP